MSMSDNKKSLITLENLETYHKKLSEQLSQITGVDNIENITYSDLKNLRDNDGLSPGRLYRITDYVTVVNSVANDVRSAGHQFDIIVEALNENTLSEQAHAIWNKSENGMYFDGENLNAWQLWYCLDNDESRFEWANSREGWKAEFIGYYWNDPTNGEEYGDSTSLDSDKIYDWEIDYDPELDDDNIVIYKSDVEIYEEEGGADYSDKFFYRGVVTIDGQEYDSWKKYEESSGWVTNEEETKFKYALTERIVFDGEVIWPEGAGEEMGKGVIYRMIDEYGNDCPYDFKNIMFKRPNAEDIGDDNYYFTFSWVEEDGNIIDASIFGNNGYLLDGGSEIPGVFSNVIGKYIENGVNKLPVNIFISNYNYENGFYYGCRNNTLGNTCYNNILGNSCDNNILGNWCTYNSFGNNCYGNSFGDYCNSNTFGNDCGYNSFGNDCNSNTFGNSCSDNSFGNDCSNNTFGNDCYENNFEGIFLRNNYLSNNCNNIIFYAQTDEIHYIQNLVIAKGVNNEEIHLQGNFVGVDHEIKVAKNSSGELKIYCEADLIA